MKPRYMIHAMPERMWYVKDFLIPSLLEQGIPKSRIKVWCDRGHDGNLLSCMSSFLWCGEHDKGGDTWHLQDDVCVSKLFATFTDEGLLALDNDIVAGFCPKKTYEDDRTGYIGWVEPEQLWYSFQCIRIPDRVAGQCARWYFGHEGSWGAAHLDNTEREGKGDDGFFMWFMTHEDHGAQVYNLTPNLVEHVDYLVDDRPRQPERDKEICLRAAYWKDEARLTQLAGEIGEYKRRRKT